MDLVGLYVGGAFAVMVILAIVNSRLSVDLARPTDAAVWAEGLPQWFVALHRDLVDLGLVLSNQDWLRRLHAAFGEGDELYRAGEDLRLLGRPGRSLVAAATCCFTFGSEWSVERVGQAMAEELEARGVELAFRLEDPVALEGGGYRARLTVGPWSRELAFELPGDVYREANAILEADGWRVVQFGTGNVVHAFALLPLPLARKLHHGELFDLIDPPGGEEVREGGTPERWYTWLY
jgi:hypothetical protein